MPGTMISFLGVPYVFRGSVPFLAPFCFTFFSLFLSLCYFLYFTGGSFYASESEKIG